MRKVLFFVILLGIGVFGYLKRDVIKAKAPFLFDQVKKQAEDLKSDLSEPDLGEGKETIKSGNVFDDYAFPVNRDSIESKVNSLLPGQSPELIAKIISYSEQVNLNPILISVIIAKISEGNPKFSDLTHSGLMGISNRHVKIAKQRESQLKTEVDLFEPLQNVAIGVLSLKSIFEDESFKTINEVIENYLSTEDELAQDLVTPSNQQLSDEIINTFKKITSSNEEIVVNVAGTKDYSEYKKYIQSLNISLAYEEDLYAVIDDNLPQGLTGIQVLKLINQLSGFNGGKLVGNKVGLFQLTSSDADKYGYFPSELIDPVINAKIAMSKFKDLYTSGITEPKKLVLNFLLGQDKVKELADSQASLDNQTSSIIDSVFNDNLTVVEVPAATPASQATPIKQVIAVAENARNYTSIIIKYGISEDIAKNINQLIITKANQYGLDSDLVFALIAAESGFKSDAVGENNKVGLLQIASAQQAIFAKLVSKEMGDLKNPEYNLDLGLSLFTFYKNVFLDKIELALAAHQLGAKEVYRILSSGESIPEPVAKFVEKVLKKIAVLKEAPKPSPTPEAIAVVEPTPVIETVSTPVPVIEATPVAIETPLATATPAPVESATPLPLALKVKEVNDVYSLVQDLIPQITSRGLPSDFADKLVRNCEVNNVDPLLMIALIKEVSDFDYLHADPNLQKYGIFKFDIAKADKISSYSGVSFGGISSLKDIDYNLRLTSKFIAALNKEFPKDNQKILSAFFWGPGNVRANKKPTQDLDRQVNNILKNYLQYKNSYKLRN